MVDIIELNRRSVRATVDLVATIKPGDLDRQTPCDGWAVRDLLAHQIVQNHGFAFAASGERSGLDMWEPRPVGDDPVEEYAASARAVMEAFAEEGVLDRRFYLPEIRDGGPFPAKLAIGFHFIDCVVHDWDFAKALGVPANVDEDLTEAALPLAAQVPDTPATRGEGKAFVTGVPAADDAPALDRLVALLGRSPAWSPS
ncbi:TIGR03086 family metal-binding protein [Nonomuraea sp. NEAU-A123]|uniref:TIGR03086 family metal-binding protein n=1 Tax=Nonomuraea sp. NEAU-A123 TaxID=2839649 RepID=UPI001BE4C184|nr:TIGR03086 family metal-binding protein [Nonomuraea sp. NEAU-A123]MBT2228678.1 TIGR03086 family protein [Nonomuraea sp. NEAU-A123]